MPKKSSAAETTTVGGQVWNKQYLDDKSGHWFELAGPFGELIVEEGRGGTFMARWWPPGITVGEPVQIGKGYKARPAAMKACVAYIQNLGQLLGTTKVLGLPC